MHGSVGALIERDGKFLMVRRRYPPPGLACVAGHIDEGETDRAAAIVREIHEEVGISGAEVTETLIDGEEVPGNYCRSVDVHRWYVYRCQVPDDAEPKFDPEETLGGGWLTPAELAQEDLEPIWRLWLERFGIIPRCPRLVICGSMRDAEAMARAANGIAPFGWIVDYPQRESTEERIRLARRHLGRIMQADAVVLWNSANGESGASAFSEASFAAAWAGKPLYTVWSVGGSSPISPELEGYGAMSLEGDFGNIARLWKP